MAKPKKVKATETKHEILSDELGRSFATHHTTLLRWANQNHICLYCIMTAYFDFISTAMAMDEFKPEILNAHLEQLNLLGQFSQSLESRRSCSHPIN